MDIQRMQQLAGMPVTPAQTLNESKQLNEGTVSEKVEIHASGPMQGQLGDIIVIEGGKTMDALAKLFGVPGGWKKTQIKPGIWAAYDGGRLTFFNKENDFQAEDEDEEF